jgi:hypothetical protein
LYSHSLPRDLPDGSRPDGACDRIHAQSCLGGRQGGFHQHEELVHGEAQRRQELVLVRDLDDLLGIGVLLIDPVDLGRAQFIVGIRVAWLGETP